MTQSLKTPQVEIIENQVSIRNNKSGDNKKLYEGIPRIKN